MNQALASSATPAADRPRYRARWTAWNQVRTVAATVPTLLLALA